ncbi:hypothetical protein [Rhodobacter viridis]|uniref:hypothetical protein n=1 Tax=Rhodobacter viridis TaxID=1054202 RepID=UPI0011B61012|nr:hypothetical protein [Rhodobacter viridis]
MVFEHRLSFPVWVPPRGTSRRDRRSMGGIAPCENMIKLFSGVNPLSERPPLPLASRGSIRLRAGRATLTRATETTRRAKLLILCAFDQ